MTKRKTRTTMIDQNNPWGIMYVSGGNPPVAAGLFGQDGDRLAWWPAGVQPTQENIDRVVRELVWTRAGDVPVTRKEIIELLDVAP